jgi:hypothetical protein
MECLSQNGELMIIQSISTKCLEHYEKTFNLHVECNNNYFVGYANILVHNGSTPLGQKGHRNYVLKRGGVIYYSGRFGPNETKAKVEARHKKTPKSKAQRKANGARFDPANGDVCEVLPGSRTYAEARRLEHEISVKEKTFVGRKNNWRGNRIYPMSPSRFKKYYRTNAC